MKQRHSLAKPAQHLYSNDILENTLFKISSGSLFFFFLSCCVQADNFYPEVALALYMYVIERIWINPVRLPILHVVS